jgi:hypothetical protein
VQGPYPSIKQAERPKDLGIDLDSSKPSIFSAGLELTEMHKPDMKRLVMFWSSFQDYFNPVREGLRIVMMQGHAPRCWMYVGDVVKTIGIMAATTEHIGRIHCPLMRAN